MRWLVGLLVAVALVGTSCSGGSAPLPRVSTDCGGNPCVRVVPQLDSDGAPLNGATVMVAFDQPVKLSGSTEVAVVNAVMNLETRQPEVSLAGVRGLRVDPRSNGRQVQVDVDALLADGSAIAFGAGVLLAQDGGKPLPQVDVKLATPWTPMAVALARVAWVPTDPKIFAIQGSTPKGTKNEAAVRQELEARLRVRPQVADDWVATVLSRYDDPNAKRRVPDNRVRASLLLLAGTSAAYATDFVLADTNRRGVPFEPVRVSSLREFGFFAMVSYYPLEGKLRLWVDTDMANESLEVLATALTHESLHSGLDDGSATEETLAMASQTRVYQEFLMWDPAIAWSGTEYTNWFNMLTLALRNSGRFGFPRAGMMPKPGIDNVLAGTEAEPARSFKDLLFKPDFYGEIPKTGDTGSEVLEAYYKRISGNSADQGHMRFDETTLKLFDVALDNGFTDEQIFAIVDALKLKPVPIGTR